MGKRKNRRQRRKSPATPSASAKQQQNSEPTRAAPTYLRWYDVHYKKLLIIPFIVLVLALAQIGFQVATTGDFIQKGITLKGGISVSLTDVPDMTTPEVEAHLQAIFPDNEVQVREINEEGLRSGLIIESDLSSLEKRDMLIDEIKALFDEELAADSISTESTGAVLGEDFFRQTMVALVVAFIFMGLVVFVFFRTFVPSLAVILAAFSDIVLTVAITNVLGIKLSTASIAAFLMLIGYSVDTDILLSNRLLKRSEGSVLERTLGAARTGLMMTVTTLVAISVALIVTESVVISQIMTILIIGLVVDLIMTWIQTVGILRLYLERKGEK